MDPPVQSIPNYYDIIVWGTTFKNLFEPLMVLYRILIKIILKQHYNENNGTYV